MCTCTACADSMASFEAFSIAVAWSTCDVLNSLVASADAASSSASDMLCHWWWWGVERSVGVCARARVHVRQQVGVCARARASTGRPSLARG